MRLSDSIFENLHEYLDAKPNKIFEILPIRGHSNLVKFVSKQNMVVFG